jgi:pyruvate kinase
MLGRLARRRKTVELVAPAQIGVSLCRKCSMFDDGKIGGVFRSVNSDSATIQITQARPEAEKLGAEKGINLPETRIDIPGLTSDDLEALKFIVQNADLVGYSFARAESDARELLDRLEGWSDRGAAS